MIDTSPGFRTHAEQVDYTAALGDLPAVIGMQDGHGFSRADLPPSRHWSSMPISSMLCRLLPAPRTQCVWYARSYRPQTTSVRCD